MKNKISMILLMLVSVNITVLAGSIYDNPINSTDNTHETIDTCSNNQALIEKHIMSTIDSIEMIDRNITVIIKEIENAEETTYSILISYFVIIIYLFGTLFTLFIRTLYIDSGFKDIPSFIGFIPIVNIIVPIILILVILKGKK